MKNSLIILILALSLWGCKKERREYILNGIITDSKTGQNLADTEVAIYKHTRGLFGSNLDLLETGTSSQDGSYKIDFKPYSNSDLIDFIVRVLKKDKYFVSTDMSDISISPDNFKKGKPYTQNISLDPQAFINLKITNTQPYDNNDQISFMFSYHANTLIGPSGSIQTGMTVNTMIPLTTVGNQYTMIDWIVNKNNIKQEYKDSIYCASFNTYTYQINY